MNDESESRLYAGVEKASSEPQDGAALLDRVAAFLCRFVVLTDEQAVAIALWVLHTHALDAAEVTPYLQIRSAEKRSGKTRLLEVLKLLVARPWLTGRTSVAALVRKVSDERCTMLLDESDAAFSGDKAYSEALRGVLNDGYQKGGNATLCVGQGSNLKARAFPVFCPKAIAGIGKHLPSTVVDRSITIELRRRVRAESVEKFRLRRVRPEGDDLRAAVESWGAENVERLSELVPDVPDAIDDRAQDIWEPLLAVADVAGAPWPECGRRAAVVLSGGRSDEDAEDGSIGIALLRDVRPAFRNEDRLHTDELLRRLTSEEFSESPWSTWHHGAPLTARALAKILRGYRIKSRQVKVFGVNRNGYYRDAFEDTWKRYLPVTDTASSTDSTTLNSQGENGDSASSTEPVGRGSGNAENAAAIRPVDPVDDKTLYPGGEPPPAHVLSRSSADPARARALLLSKWPIATKKL
jgi:hypothetical protein